MDRFQGQGMRRRAGAPMNYLAYAARQQTPYAGYDQRYGDGNPLSAPVEDNTGQAASTTTAPDTVFPTRPMEGPR